MVWYHMVQYHKTVHFSLQVSHLFLESLSTCFYRKPLVLQLPRSESPPPLSQTNKNRLLALANPLLRFPSLLFMLFSHAFLFPASIASLSLFIPPDTLSLTHQGPGTLRLFFLAALSALHQNRYPHVMHSSV